MSLPAIGNEPVARNWKSHVCCRNPKGLTKDIAVTSKKTAIGWIFRQLLFCTILGPTERKCWFLANKVQDPASHSVCVRAVSKHFPDRPRITGSFLQRKLDGTDILMLFACPCECGGFPYCNIVRGNFYLKMTSKQGFTSSLLLSAYRML